MAPPHADQRRIDFCLGQSENPPQRYASNAAGPFGDVLQVTD
jgi:hypothetical protein